MNTLTVRGLTRKFGSHVVLDDVSFTVSAGQVVVLVGPNGAGKTTLLRCIMGLEKPDAGEVLLEGRELVETDPEIRAALAAALDDMDFFSDLSVVEHLELLAFAFGGDNGAGATTGAASGDAAAATHAEVARIVAELGLEEAADQLPATLSSGQRRRLALASCFVRPRRLLVLDEPEQRLDARGRAWLTERLLAEKAAGRAVLLASHDPALIDAVADARVELGG